MKNASTHKNAGKNNPNWKGGNIKVACAYCGKEKEVYPCMAKLYNKSFCNDLCRGKWMSENMMGKNNPKWKPKLEISCAYCGEKLLRYPSRVKNHPNQVCNDICRAKLQARKVRGKNNPNYNGGSPEQKIIGKRISAGMRKSLKKGKDGYSWEKLLGYTRKQLYIHLDSTMPDGYTWDDIDDLHIDHIVPKSSFNFSDYSDDEFKKCWAIDNLQFLPAVENMQKGCKEAVRQ